MIITNIYLKNIANRPYNVRLAVICIEKKASRKSNIVPISSPLSIESFFVIKVNTLLILTQSGSFLY